MAALFDQNITAPIEASHKRLQKCNFFIYFLTMAKAQEIILQKEKKCYKRMLPNLSSDHR